MHAGIGFNETMQTIEEIKQNLPDVLVRMDKKMTVTGRVSGRRNAFATVSCEWHGVPVQYEYAWETIAHAVNNNTPLRV